MIYDAFVPSFRMTIPTSFLHHVGETPQARHRSYTRMRKHLQPDIVLSPGLDNTSGPTSFLHHVGTALKSLKMLKTQMIFGVSRLFINSIIIIIVFKLIIYRYSC